MTKKTTTPSRGKAKTPKRPSSKPGSSKRKSARGPRAKKSQRIARKNRRNMLRKTWKRTVATFDLALSILAVFCRLGMPVIMLGLAFCLIFEPRNVDDLSLLVGLFIGALVIMILRQVRKAK